MCCCEMATNKVPYFFATLCEYHVVILNYNNQCINIFKVPERDVENLGLYPRYKHLPRDLADIIAGKHMLDISILA